MTLQEKENKYLNAKKEYYKGNPIMTDSQFDELEDELRSLNSDVVNIVGYYINRKEIPHLSPMKSLQKMSIVDIDQLDDFYKDFVKWYQSRIGILSNPANPFGDISLRGECKYDGSSCSIVYKNGKFSHAVTRGDGKVGTDISDKLKLIVPLTIHNTATVEIRGEVNIKTEIFENKYAVKYKNARNFVAGVLGRDENFEDEVKDFTFIAFEKRVIENNGNIIFVDDPSILLASYGFYVPEMIVRKINYRNIKDVVKTFYDYRYTKSPFGLDGMVIKFPEKLRDELGETDHHPKAHIAIKFPPIEAVTEIIGIEWQIGQSGRFTPIGKLKGVDLDGSFVQNVTLHNWENIIKEGLFPGAVIKLVKGGDIIPGVKSVVKPIHIISASQSFYMPKHDSHPDCNVTVSGPHLVCTNPNCPDIKIAKLMSGIRSFGIENIGPATVSTLYKCGICNIMDLFNPIKFNEYCLTEDNHFKSGRALDIILDAPTKVTVFDYPSIINALCFPNVGKRMSKEIAKIFQGETPDFTSMSFAAYSPFLITDSPEYELVEEFRTYLDQWGYLFETSATKQPNTNVTGKTYKVVLTGSPKEHGFKTKAEFLAKYPNLVEVDKLQDADYLITDDLSSSTSKMEKATKLGVKIIEYSDAKMI